MVINKYRSYSYLILCVFFYIFYVKQAYSDSFNILIPEDVKQDYILFLQGRNPLTIKDFNSPYSRRDVVEVNLLEQALFIGGNKLPYKLLTSFKYNSHLHHIKTGKIDIIGTSVWQSMFKKGSVLFSNAVIENGRFESGLYTSPKNFQMLVTKDLISLTNKTAISNRAWSVDWQVLNQLNLSQLWHTDQWHDMAAMVYDKRVDFVIAPFQPRGDLSLRFKQIKLIPVPDIKIILPGSRHFAISKKSKYSQQLLTQINQGLAKLKEQGVIERAYRQSGFYNIKVKDWKVLN